MAVTASFRTTQCAPKTCRPGCNFVLPFIRSRGRLPVKPPRFRESERGESVSSEMEQQVEQTASQVRHQVSGVLSSPSTQSAVYATLAAVAAAVALPALLAPAWVAGLVFWGTADSVVHSMVRTVGATLLASFTAKATLREAAALGQMHLPTFRRLNLAVALHNLGLLAVLAQGVSVRTDLLTGLMGAACGASALAALRISSVQRGDGSPLPSLRHTAAGALSALVPRNPTAAAYSLLTLVCAAMAALLLGAHPGQRLEMYGGVAGPVTVFARRAAGAGMTLVTLMAYSLKDGADRDKLHATTFRWLNLGLAATFAAMAADMAVGPVLSSRLMWGMLAAQAGAALWAFGNFVRFTRPE